MLCCCCCCFYLFLLMFSNISIYIFSILQLDLSYFRHLLLLSGMIFFLYSVLWGVSWMICFLFTIYNFALSYFQNLSWMLVFFSIELNLPWQHPYLMLVSLLLCQLILDSVAKVISFGIFLCCGEEYFLMIIC